MKGEVRVGRVEKTAKERLERRWAGKERTGRMWRARRKRREGAKERSGGRGVFSDCENILSTSSEHSPKPITYNSLSFSLFLSLSLTFPLFVSFSLFLSLSLSIV